jgi:hypothetical protein
MADRRGKSDPDKAGWQSDLPVAYLKVGDVRLARGNLAEALKSYRKGLAIAERMARRPPSEELRNRSKQSGDAGG